MQPNNSIQKLIDLFSKFPTIGQRTASRFVFYLLRQPKEKTDALILAIQDLKAKVKCCNFCFDPFESPEESLCEICKNPGRDRTSLCMVEKEADLATIENTKKYKGLYFILGGNVATLKKTDIDNLRINELAERIKTPNNFGVAAEFKEVIIATNPTPEGRAAAMLVEKTIRQTNDSLKITHLGLGLPVGGELEYADEETLERAFEGRK